MEASPSGTAAEASSEASSLHGKMNSFMVCGVLHTCPGTHNDESHRCTEAWHAQVPALMWIHGTR